MSNDSSHHTSTSKWPRVAARLEAKATVMAMLMSSIIPGRRCRSSASPPVRKGQPP